MKYIVFDIGGTFVKYSFMERSGNIIFKGKFRSPTNSLENLISKMSKIIDSVSKEQLQGISICCPGVVDSDKGIVYYGGCLEYLHKVNFKKIFKNEYDISVSIENDGKAAALAELWRGAIKNTKEAVVLVLGSAIGGGLIINGQLHRGHHYSAGEVSYMVGNSIEEKDVCLRAGFDASASKMVKDVAVANNLSPKTDGEIVFEYINKDNEKSWKIFTDFCRKVAKIIISLQYIVDPQKFVIGGGISNQPIVCQQIKNIVNKMYDCNPQYSLVPKIVNSKLNDNANLYGAFYHFIEEYIENESH